MKNGIGMNKDRISRISQRLIWVLWGVIVIAPILDTFVWIWMNELLVPMQQEILPAFVQLPLPGYVRFLGWCVSLIPLALFIYGCRTCITLFRLYESGEIFGAENVRCFSKLSRIFIYWCILSILQDPIQSVVLTLHHPPGQHVLALGLSSVELTYLFVGFILAVISRVMEEGRKIQEDQELTI